MICINLKFLKNKILIQFIQFTYSKIIYCNLSLILIDYV